MYLPPEIMQLTGNKTYVTDDIGQSGSLVLIYDDMVLKIQDISEETDREVKLMQWLEGKINAPVCLCHVKENGRSYLLMSRISGEMACDIQYMADPTGLMSILAEGLQQLWKVDISDCPVRSGLDEKLKMAEYNLLNGLVDTENCQPDTFGEGGFKDPGHLLEWLKENRPEEDNVLSHGDFCLPNIFIDEGEVSGFIDIGRMGIADRWNDIAICYRSLNDNYTGKYSTRKYNDFDPDSFFEALGIVKDEVKLRYYILLDEMF